LISETGTGGKLFFLEVKDLKNQDLTPYVKQYAINTELVARSIYALNVSDLVGSYYIRVVNYAGTGYAINTKIEGSILLQLIMNIHLYMVLLDTYNHLDMKLILLILMKMGQLI
jgi:hypothetical protein